MPVVSVAVLQPFVDGWTSHQQRLIAALETLNEDQLALRPAAGEWTIWQVGSHIAGSRAYWFHDVLGEGDPGIRDMFRVGQTTVPGLSLDDAGWEDDESRPRTAAEIVTALRVTWETIAACLERWRADDLTVQMPQPRSNRTTTRGWVTWHLMEHEAHHGGAISVVLGSNGLPGLNL